MNKSIAWLLLLICLCTAGAAHAGAEIADGVGWDLTVEQMLALEGAAAGDTQAYTDGDLVQYSFVHPSEDAACAVVYVFHNEALAAYLCDLDPYSQLEDAQLAETYDAQYALFAAQYGEPASEDPHRIVDLFSAIGQSGMAAENFLGYAYWEFGDGTSLHLLYTVYDVIFYMYVDDDRLPG